MSEEIFCPPPCAEKRGDIVFGFPSFRPPSGSRYFVYATPATVLLRLKLIDTMYLVYATPPTVYSDSFET